MHAARAGGSRTVRSKERRVGKGTSSSQAHARPSRHANSRVGTLRFGRPTRRNSRPSPRLNDRAFGEFVLEAEIENAAGSKGGTVVAKDRILPAEGGGMRGTRAGSRRQGHARAFSQVSGFMAQHRYESLPAPAPDQTPQWRLSPLTPEPSTHDWRWRPNDARRSGSGRHDPARRFSASRPRFECPGCTFE